ncbi:hypothetical protein G6011_05049 [Alternaria panax]|uniref:Uncharacterized protein n=1 Tax=Alternaria panax TaxID=48097 RepID=A0AAD4FC08_9PLEO|nr:hypothetical protein G6011_05049 [Alternaria panax]
MESNAISQPKELLSAAPDLRTQLSNAKRLKLSGLAEAPRNKLERPDEAVFRITVNEGRQPGHYLAIRLAIQWGSFEALGDVGEKGKTSAQLAEGTRADPRLVGWKVPSFLDLISHRNRADINNGPFQHAHGFADKSLYTYFDEDAAMGARFGGMIQMYNTGKPFFWEDGYYPFEERLVSEGPKSDDEVLLVDIGGGDAGDLGLLRKALGEEVKGRLVLQELKHIVDRSDEDGFETQVGD